MRSVFRVFSLVLISGLCLADNLTYMRIDQSILSQRALNAPNSPQARIDSLRAQFHSAGCTGSKLQEQTVPDQALPNLICTLPGADPGAIVIGARVDFQATGDEAIVQWATVALLPVLAESLDAAPHRHTLIFAAFTGHEHGFAGASYYLQQLSESQRKSIVAMIDLDHLGRVPASYAFPSPDTSRMATVGKRAVLKEDAPPETTLSKILPAAARALKLADEPALSSETGATDARTFDEAGVMAITIYSHAYTVITRVGNSPVHLMRTAVDPKVYSDTYNLLCVYTLFLDKALGTGKPKQPATAATQVAGVGATPEAANPPAGSATAAATASAPPAASTTATTTASSAATVPPPAQKAATNDTAEPTATFKATTRLVQVDVVVTDKNGKPIEGLTEGDFAIFQDGRPQKVRAFEPHLPGSAAAASSASASPVQRPKLPPDTYTNFPGTTADQNWTVILFDMLNTPTRDQQNARKQLVTLVKSLPPGQPVALFVLTRYLIMAQAFTQNPNELLASAQRLLPGNAQLLSTAGQTQEETGMADYASRELTSSAPAGSNTGIAAGGIEQSLRNIESFRTEQRVIFTLDALKGLSRAVSGYPGRKNLIWLSGAFPVRLEPDLAAQDGKEFRNTRNYVGAVRDTGALLAESRVAVYPVDIRGLQGRGVDASISTPASGSYVGVQDVAPGGSHGVQATSNSNEGSLLNQQASTYIDERATMTGLAEQTGGRAILNSNDIRGSINRVMNDGATFYTLAYTPDKNDDKFGYHRIEVKLTHSDSKLSYRRGYYSEPKTASQDVGVAALRASLQPGMPPATMLYVLTTVHMPVEGKQDVLLDYVISPNNVTFADTPEHKKHVTLDCMIVAYDKEGNEAAHASDTLDGALSTTAYDAVMAQGIPAKQVISLKPGTYTLRVGVMDRATQQIGTVTLPMVINGTAAAKKD